MRLLEQLFIDKRYHGGLVASGRGQMLGARTAAQGSGRYVAFEQVTGNRPTNVR